MVATNGDLPELNARIAAGHAQADNDNLRAENARLQAQVEGMQEKGCTALGLVENIFNGLTSEGKPTDPKLAQMAEAAAVLMTEATPCGHKALAEREALRGLAAKLAQRLQEAKDRKVLLNGMTQEQKAAIFEIKAIVSDGLRHYEWFRAALASPTQGEK